MIKMKTMFASSKLMRQQADADHAALLPLIKEFNRLENLIENTDRDVEMWTNRVTKLKLPESSDRRNLEVHLEVAEEELVKAQAAKESIKANLVEDMRIAAAQALLDRINLVNAGLYDWVAIDASREKRIGTYNAHFDALSQQMRDYMKSYRRHRRYAVKCLEEGRVQEAVKCMEASKMNKRTAEDYPRVLKRLQQRREACIHQHSIAMLGEWLRTVPDMLRKLIEPIVPAQQ